MSSFKYTTVGEPDGPHRSCSSSFLSPTLTFFISILAQIFNYFWRVLFLSPIEFGELMFSPSHRPALSFVVEDFVIFGEVLRFDESPSALSEHQLHTLYIFLCFLASFYMYLFLPCP
uniref:Putative ovule protein n=1 Tax=Solanum chacoense TaxID=4108 RepID=A0A0V0GS26_SOLCH